MALVFKRFLNHFFKNVSVHSFRCNTEGLMFQKLDVCVCMFCFIFVQGLILWV